MSNNKEKKISFVLPVHNGQNYIGRTIKSLLEQEGEKEIIIINDASTDNTARIIAHYRPQLDLVLNFEERKGGAYCRNKGNSLTTGEIIAVCDADIYYKDRSKIIREFFKQNPECDVFYSALHFRKVDNPYEEYLMEAYKWDFKSKCPISHPTMAFTKKVSKKYPYLEETKESDLFEFRLLKMNKDGVKFGGSQNPTMLKIEGDTIRDRSIADKIKKDKYKEWEIII